MILTGVATGLALLGGFIVSVSRKRRAKRAGEIMQKLGETVGKLPIKK